MMKLTNLGSALAIGVCLATYMEAPVAFAQTVTQERSSPNVPWLKEPAAPTASEPLPDMSKRLPMGTLHIDGRTATIPDWQVISFDVFPPFPTDGQWGDVAWSKGDRLADVVTLGDFQGTLDLQLLTIASIAEAIGMPTQMGRKNPVYRINLSQFQLLEHQTIASLVVAVPSLLDVPIAKLPLIQDLVRSVQPTFIFKSKTLETLLSEYPDFGEIKLSKLILEDYQVGDLPGIELVPLQSFAHWQEAAISEVPLLSVMSWWLFPQKPQTDGEIVVSSIRPLESADADAAHALVLTPRTSLEPVEWVVGEEEDMTLPKSGSQERTQINAGKELQGAFPFGPAFKVVPEVVTPEGVQMAIYFRTCRQSRQLDCSAYGIGPIPLQTYRPGETVFLGEYAFPVAPLPPDPAVASNPVPTEPTTDFFDVVVDAAIEHQGPIGTVVMIFTLLGGVLWWTWRGDPIQFVVLTFQWMTAAPRRVTHQLASKPDPSTIVESPDAEQS